MPSYSVTSPRRDRLSPGTDPLDALLTVHRDGLGPRAVRLVDGAFWFADPADRELCAGAWRVTPLAVNGGARDVVIEIPEDEPAAGAREAA